MRPQMTIDFLDSYRSTQWQKKKNKILTRDNFTCAICGKHGDEHTLMHVHHITYKNCKNGKAWDCPDEDLVTLCEDCHKKVHSGFPYKRIEENFIFYNKSLSFLQGMSGAYKLSLHTFNDGIGACLLRKDNSEYIVIKNGNVSIPKAIDENYQSLPDADIIFKSYGILTSEFVRTVEALISHRSDLWCYEDSWVTDFVNLFPWDKNYDFFHKKEIGETIMYHVFKDDAWRKHIAVLDDFKLSEI